MTASRSAWICRVVKSWPARGLTTMVAFIRTSFENREWDVVKGVHSTSASSKSGLPRIIRTRCLPKRASRVCRRFSAELMNGLVLSSFFSSSSAQCDGRLPDCSRAALYFSTSPAGARICRPSLRNFESPASLSACSALRSSSSEKTLPYESGHHRRGGPVPGEEQKTDRNQGRDGGERNPLAGGQGVEDGQELFKCPTHDELPVSYICICLISV